MAGRGEVLKSARPNRSARLKEFLHTIEPLVHLLETVVHTPDCLFDRAAEFRRLGIEAAPRKLLIQAGVHSCFSNF
ncbi:MAG: hypothetical protein R6V67_03415 [Spirochaetia bacterium]